jgi:hypothetical protein
MQCEQLSLDAMFNKNTPKIQFLIECMQLNLT